MRTNLPIGTKMHNRGYNIAWEAIEKHKLSELLSGIVVALHETGADIIDHDMEEAVTAILYAQKRAQKARW